MITKFHVRNYKALRDVTLELTPAHILIGPNDSGKTSILEALAALCRSVDLDLSNSFIGSWSGVELVWHNSQDPMVGLEVEVDDDSAPFRYWLATRFYAGRGVRVDKESVEMDQDGLLEFPNAGGRTWIAHAVVHGDNSGGTKVVEAARRVHDLLSGVHFYRWVPRFLSLPVAPDSRRRFRMESSGFGLALCLDDILGFDREKFVALEQRFRQIFPAIKSIKLIPEPAFRAPVDDPQQIPMLQQAEGKGIYFEFVNDENLVPAAQVSDGVLLVLAYLTVLYLPKPPRVVLVEEPENGIHPARLREVLSILRDLVKSQEHTQVVLTTHSPYVVDLFSPDEVTLCQKGEDGAVQVRRLSESKAVRDQIDVFTLGEIWTSDGDTALMQPVEAGGAGDK